eukprot:m.13289 g.13289  ORF g.13289 m.13289 type:complete len:163 (+) comp4133_c0_seq1:52-540(+)
MEARDLLFVREMDTAGLVFGLENGCFTPDEFSVALKTLKIRGDSGALKKAPVSPKQEDTVEDRSDELLSFPVHSTCLQAIYDANEWTLALMQEHGFDVAFVPSGDQPHLRSHAKDIDSDSSQAASHEMLASHQHQQLQSKRKHHMVPTKIIPLATLNPSMDQ